MKGWEIGVVGLMGGIYIMGKEQRCRGKDGEGNIMGTENDGEEILHGKEMNK